MTRPTDTLPSKSFNRRKFLAATAGAMAAPHFVPAHVLGGSRHVAPSEQITLGGIGIRNRGTKVLNTMLPQADVRFVAIADVRADRRSAVKQLADETYGNSDCQTYQDFRELLARDDIDAVLIATGDRWHGPMSMYAAEAGKDIYSEKPCAISMELSRRLAETIKRTGRVFQCGTQRRSISNFIHAINLARSGRLGKLTTLHASIYQLEDRHDWLPAQPQPARDVVDWDMWLGPAPWRPFNQAYVDGRWRGYFDFDSGAKLLDWGAHTLDLCQQAAGEDGSTPVSYQPLDLPDDNAIDCIYSSGVKVRLRRNGWLGLGTCPVRFEGTEGWVETGDSGRIQVSHDELRRDLPEPTIAGTTPSTHTRNFLDCVKSRGIPACNEDVMRKSHVACHAAAIAWKLGRKLDFDPDTETFVDDDQANRMRSRAMRSPWLI